MILHFEEPEAVEQRDSFKQAIPWEPTRLKLIKFFYPDHQGHAIERVKESPDTRFFYNWYTTKNHAPAVEFGFISRVEIVEGTNGYLTTEVMSIEEWMAELQVELTRRNRKDDEEDGAPK